MTKQQMYEHEDFHWTWYIPYKLIHLIRKINDGFTNLEKRHQERWKWFSITLLFSLHEVLIRTLLQFFIFLHELFLNVYSFTEIFWTAVIFFIKMSWECLKTVVIKASKYRKNLWRRHIWCMFSSMHPSSTKFLPPSRSRSLLLVNERG